MSAPETSQSQMISILPINGVDFSAGGKVIFELDASLGFIKASRGESYLAVSVRNNSTSLRTMFATSGQALIKDVSVFSLISGTQYETLQNYNQAIWILDQYNNVVFGHQQSIEGMKKEPYAYEFDTASTLLPKRRYTGSDGTPESVMNSILSPISETGVLIPLAYTVCIPLRLGIFGAFSEEKLCPLLPLGGLRIEITLENASPAMVPICTTLNGIEFPMVATPVSAGAGTPVVQGGDGTSTLWLQGDGINVESIGYTVGQTIQFVSTGEDLSTTITAIGVSGTAGTSIQLTVADACAATGATGRIATLPDTWEANVNYTIDAIEFRALQVQPSSATISKLTKAMNYSYRTYELLFDSIPASSTRHQTEIQSVSSRAKSVMAFMYDNTLETEANAPAYFAGTDPDLEKLNSVQFFMNQRLYPLNSYNPQRRADRPQTLNELAKAFKAIDMPVLSFGDGSGANLDAYSNSFVVARELARDDYVYDLRSAKAEIRLGFSAARTNVLRVNTFVWQDRVVQIGPNGVMVIQ